MKLSKAETAVLCAGAALLILMGGYALGNGRTEPLQMQGQVETLPAVEETAAPVDEKIDVNTAGLEALMELPGIGEKRARAILDYRAEHGPFRYVEDLICVPGIGEGILEGLMDYAVAGGADDAENSGS